MDSEMQQALGQSQIGQSTQMVQQTSLAQAQQQMAQSQLTQQQIAQSQIAQQQMAQQQQQIAQSQLAQQQQQIAQSQIAQQQLAQSQIAQQQMAQTQMVQQQMAQSQMAQQQMGQPQIIQQQITQPQLIQQQLAQQQISQQQLQQMMYCPTVRLVYDTPMQLVQPGDQMQQQNQNIYVNQPPWARPVQNQVIYVQQIGSNLVPVQHIDPNMFIQQNIPMYQQVVQNVPQLVQNIPQTVQTLPQGPIRQIINNIPAGIVPNFGTNIPRIQDPNIGQMVQNFGLVQTNSDVPMNNVNVANNEIDRQAITNQVNVQQNAPTQELMNVYRQVVPQVNQQQIRTQVPTSQQNNVQNVQTSQQMVTNVGQSVGTNTRPVGNVNANTQPSTGIKINNVRPNTPQIMPNTQPKQIITTANNVGHIQQIRHVQPQNLNTALQNVPQNIPNSSAMQSYTTSVGTLNTVTYSAVRNGQPYTYRAIQPKPNTTTNNNNNVRVNFKPRASQMNMVRRPAPNVLNAPNNNQNVSVSTNTIPTSTNYIKMETESPTFNRKRKSESPDEIHKKISNYGSITVTAQVKDKIKAKYANTSEIGVNTSPVHKPHKVNQNKIENQMPLLQINPMDAKIKQEFLSPTAAAAANPAPVLNINANFSVKMETGAEVKEKKDSKDVSQQTEEKLVRKTVFPQAKATGRLLDVKASLDMPKIDEPVSNINIIHNETLQGPRINVEPKNNTNAINNEIQQVPQVNSKLNENTKFEEIKAIKNTSPTNSNSTMPGVATQKTCNFEVLKTILNTPTITNSNSTMPDTIVTPDKPVKTSVKLNEPDVTKMEMKPAILPLQTNKEIQSILPPKEEQITKPTASGNTEPQSVNNEKISEKGIEPANREKEKHAKDTKPETPEADAKVATESDFEEEIKDNKIEKKEYKNISINEMKGKEIHIVDGNIHKEERDFVLTHVLDGFVIQESNVPFAIRRPLKEKTVNAYVEDKNDPCIKAAKDEIRGHILELSQLHINESKEKERIELETRLKINETEDSSDKIIEDEQIATESKTEKEEEEKVVENDITNDNPFESLNSSTVKSWTINDLASHLTKYNWNETVSTLQEHEIDGESLFLVTKSQLVTIGLNEAHADVICDFVGSKN